MPSALLQVTRAYATHFDDDDDEMPSIFQRERPQRRNTFNDNSNDGFRRAAGFGKRDGGFSRGDRSFGRDFGGHNKSFQGGRSGAFQDRGRQQGRQQQQTLSRIDWSEHELSELKKDFYQPSEVTTNRSQEEIAKYRADNNIVVPQNAPNPILQFDELQGLPKNILDAIQEAKFPACTSIQAQGMPIALSGQNMVGIAQTG